MAEAPRPSVPGIRVTPCNGAPVRPDGDYVLYWMIAARRTFDSFALDSALEHCRELGRPLVVLEALRADYPYASDRLHRFAIQGMADNAARFAGGPVRHYPYVEPTTGAGRGLLQGLAERACVVVTDEFPDFFLPRMVAAAARKLTVRLEMVDGIGLLPLRGAARAFTHAQHFRRHLQRELPAHLEARPVADPLQGLDWLPRLPENALAAVERRFPPAGSGLLAAGDAALSALPIDHSVPPAPIEGGTSAARLTLERFLDDRLDLYAEKRNQIDPPIASGLSPYLHWGFISTHRIFEEVASREGWHEGRLAPRPTGGRAGWWGMSPGAEAFLDELVTWRELTHNTSFLLPDHTRIESLPLWARTTLQKHASDPRPVTYSLEELESGATHDPLWNAAQGELRAEGRMHNYLRMLWGKSILAWTRDPVEALGTMAYLNDRWALDGRDPNSWGGFFWCLGRYDRPWAPERPIFGTVRYMTSASTARKLRVKDYVARYAKPTS
jgi:deoxyribodipyrimidine photo-lyase